MNLPHKYSINFWTNFSHCSTAMLTDSTIPASINRTRIPKSGLMIMSNTNSIDGGMSEQKVDC